MYMRNSRSSRVVETWNLGTGFQTCEAVTRPRDCPGCGQNATFARDAGSPPRPTGRSDPWLFLHGHLHQRTDHCNDATCQKDILHRHERRTRTIRIEQDLTSAEGNCQETDDKGASGIIHGGHFLKRRGLNARILAQFLTCVQPILLDPRRNGPWPTGFSALLRCRDQSGAETSGTIGKARLIRASLSAGCTIRPARQQGYPDRRLPVLCAKSGQCSNRR